MNRLIGAASFILKLVGAGTVVALYLVVPLYLLILTVAPTFPLKLPLAIAILMAAEAVLLLVLRRATHVA